MKTKFIIIVLLWTTKFFAQDSLTFDASIVVLYPNKTNSKNVPDSLKQTFKLTEEEKLNNKPDTFNKSSPNVKLIAVKESEFLNNIDYFGEYTLRLVTFLGYNLFENFNNMIAYPKYLKVSPSVSAMKKFAINEKTNWVINIKNVSVTGKDNQFSGHISLCVYNLLQDTIILDKSYELNDINHGSMFACKDHSINCVINDFIYQAGNEILNTMLADKKYWERK